MLDIRALERERCQIFWGKKRLYGRDFSTHPIPTLNIYAPFSLLYLWFTCHLSPSYPVAASPTQAHLTCEAVLSCSNTCPHTSKISWWLFLKSSLIVSSFSPLWQAVKEDSLILPAVNPLVTPQKSGNTLDNNLHKDLFGAISGIGNARGPYLLVCSFIL